MSRTSLPSQITDLLADRAAGSLSPADQAVLDQFLAAHPEANSEVEAFERAVSALLLVSISKPDDVEPELTDSSLSQELTAILEAQAKAFFAGKSAAETTVATEKKSLDANDPSVYSERSVPDSLSKPFSYRTVWGILAIAASLLIGFEILRNSIPQDRKTLGTPRDIVNLLKAERDVIQVAWTKTEHPAAAEAAGEILWSDSLQQGVMSFTGLPVNNPAEYQYQLWIFDANQSAETPVDGGVFDVTQQGEVLVPIDAKLKIKRPTLFAITMEKPGGVVVSSRKDLPLLAKVEVAPGES